MTAATAMALSAFRALGERSAPAPTTAKRLNAGPDFDGSDRGLMARVADGDKGAIRIVFERYQLKVYRFVVRLVENKATAEDIVSEVFLDLWRNAAKFEGRARLSTWIMAIARHKAMSALRGRVDQPLDAVAAEKIPDCAATAEEALHEGQRSAALRACLQQLPAAQREIIDLVYYHEMSVEEVAETVGIPPATVKTRMFYARRRLGAYLRAAGVDTI
jgi:RNA polymerase sigma-70 factor, ECF subfamily